MADIDAFRRYLQDQEQEQAKAIRKLRETVDELRNSRNMPEHQAQLEARLGKYDSDFMQEERRAEQQCRYCFYVDTVRPSQRGFFKVHCALCDAVAIHDTADTDKLCRACAANEKRCRHCGATLD